MGYRQHDFHFNGLHCAALLLSWLFIIGPAQAAWTVVDSLTGGDVAALSRDSNGNIFAITNSIKGSVQRTDTFKSADNGQSWTRMQVDTSMADLNISGISADGNGNVFANAQSSVNYFTNYGIYKSTDGGNSWSNISADGTVYFIDTSNNIFAYFPASGMMKSTDGGSTWTAISGAVAASLCADSGSTLLCYNRGLYVSSDGGNTWAKITTDLPVNRAGGRTVHALVADGGNFYASVDAGFIYANGAFTISRGVYKSSDGGSTWVAVNTGMTDGTSLSFYTTSLAAGASGELYVTAIDSTSGVITIYRSTDGAANWSSVLTPPTPVQALLVSGSTVLAGMEDHGVTRSTDSGGTWAAANAGLTAVHVNALMSRANGDLLAATSDVDVAISSDDGANWNTASIGDNTSGHRNSVSLAEDSSGTLYAPTSYRAAPGALTEGKVFKSTDNGATWSAATWPASTGTTGTALVFNNTDSTLYLGTGVGIYTSTDGAASWIHTGNNTSITAPSDLLAAANGDIYITATGLSRSSDSGASWNIVSTGASLNADIFQDRSGTLFAFGIDLRKSTDNGATWSSAISVLPVGGTANALLDDGAGTLYLAVSGATTPSQSGIYASTDGGDSWIQNNTGLDNLEVKSLALGSDGNVYAGTNGGGLYRMAAGTGGGGSDTTNPVVTAPANITLAADSASGTPASSAAIAAFLSAATATDNVGIVGGVTNDAPATFPAGTTTTVTFTATDAAGNTGTATATVTVGAFTGGSSGGSSGSSSGGGGGAFGISILLILLGGLLMQNSTRAFGRRGTVGPSGATIGNGFWREVVDQDVKNKPSPASTDVENPGKNMGSAFTAAAIFTALFLVPFGARANLIDLEYGSGAGSFELQGGAFLEYGNRDFMRLSAGSTMIKGWTVGGNGVDYLREPLHLAYGAGAYSVDLAAQTAGTLATTFATTLGDEYLLKFYAYGSSSGGVFSGRVSAGSLSNQLFTPANVSRPNSAVYTAFDFLFTATSSTTTLLFDVASSPTGFGPVIDNVSVTRSSLSVPEPGTLALLSLGLITLATAGRKRANPLGPVNTNCATRRIFIARFQGTH